MIAVMNGKETMSEETIFKEGQAIGPYRIVRCIGCGGMGEVYEVEHESLGVRYALKTFVYKGGKSWPMLRAKFMEEGQVLARLRHPNLVRVFDLSIDGATGVAYYVMDLVLYKDGNPYTLADVVRSSASEDYLYTWFRDLCNALDYIHSKGVVHRDVKLNNILLNADKHVTLSDFGIAHIFGDGLVKASAGACPTGAFYADGNRMVLGTDRYMSPEVAAGEEPTPAADTYALGVVMFMLLTGVWYESGLDARALLAGGKWKYRWAEVLPSMLARKPKDRPQILAQAVIGLLPSEESAGDGKEIRTRGRRRTRAVAMWGGAALLAVVGIFVGLKAWRVHKVSLQDNLRRAEVERQKQAEQAAHRKVEEEDWIKLTVREDELNANLSPEKEVKPVKSEAVPRTAVERTEERKGSDLDKPTPVIKEVCKVAEAPREPERPAKEYRWHDGSGEPLEVEFEIGGGIAARLLPFKAAGSAFWMSRMPVSVAAWRAVNGGYDGLDSIATALPAECPLCVIVERTEAEAFCRAMTERFRASLPKGYEVRLATENEMRAALAEDETARLCEATGRSVDDCVGLTGAVARARFRRMKADCRLERFGKWAEDGQLTGKKVVIGGLPMPRASGVVGLCNEGTKASPLHFVVGKVK